MRAVEQRSAKEWGVELDTGRQYYLDAFRQIRDLRPAGTEYYFEIRRSQVERLYERIIEEADAAKGEHAEIVRAKLLDTAHKVQVTLLRMEGHFPEAKKTMAGTLQILAATGEKAANAVSQKMMGLSVDELRNAIDAEATRVLTPPTDGPTDDPTDPEQ